MNAPDGVLCGRRRLPPPPPALRSRCAHASAVAESPESRQRSFTGRRCCRGELPPFTGVVHLLSCLYISSPMLSYTVGERVDTLEPAGAPPPEVTIEGRFKTGAAIKQLGGSVAQDTVLAFRKVKHTGTRVIEAIAERSRPVRDKVKKGAHLAYKGVRDTSMAAAEAVQRAARKTDEEARKTWRALFESAGKMWRHMGLGVQRLGTWMLENELSTNSRMNEVTSNGRQPQNASTD